MIEKVFSLSNISPIPEFTDVYRVKRKSVGNKVFIVLKFLNWEDKLSVLKAAKSQSKLNTKIFGENMPDRKIYINNQLTQHANHLFFMVKKYKQSHENFKFVWIKGRRILMRKDEKSNVIHVLNKKTLNNLNV